MIFISILNVLGVHVVLTYGCGPSEYRSGAGECCPMCSAGTVVLRDCSGDFSTSCKPCTRGTFMNNPNGFKNCFQCKSCDSEQGLYVLHKCTSMSNTVCDILDGYYCTEYTDSECSFALKHRHCSSGEEIKAPGTKTSDTVCEACPSGYYSPLGINCTKWTDCSAKNEIQDKEGSSVEDVHCKPMSRERYGLIAVGVVVVLTTASFLTYSCTAETKKTSQQVSSGNLTDDTLIKPVQESSSLQNADSECSLTWKHRQCDPGGAVRTPGYGTDGNSVVTRL
ncbi:tumor necrosis factor receptor superfamily member 5-like isoform X2 [Salminus brasiliensis]|uniref:tumor necrosis factor receptor superfamily member 5-like isoform X2 n=1 Tax=Salminus brasiliensis TaxID=930266 RepID=UPI003B82CEF0